MTKKPPAPGVDVVKKAKVRTHRFAVRLTDEEWDRTNKLARHFGVTAGGLVRMLLREKERVVNLPGKLSQ